MGNTDARTARTARVAEVETGADNETVKYRTETVKVVRGFEAKTIAKRAEDGWELVSETPGTLRTALEFRKPIPKTQWLPLAIIGGVLAVLFAFIGIMAAITGDKGDQESASVTTPSAAPVPPREETPVEPEETDATLPAETPAPDISAAVPITVDELLGKLNSADMGGVKTGDLFKVTGEPFMSDLWMTGATGDYFVMLKAQGGEQDLTVFADETAAAGWTDGTKVEMILRVEDATINGETSAGWLRAVSATVVP